MIKNLDVYFNELLVGKLGISKDNKIIFKYSDYWIKNGFSISPFSLPLENKIFYSSSNKFDGLFGVFNDSFVDFWGELLIRKYLLKRGIKYDSLSILDKLSLIGNVTMGGLTYKPSENLDKESLVNDLDKISEEINNLITHDESEMIDDIFKLGGSSGGSRPKILTKYNNKNVIVKFRSRLDPENIAKLEYDYMRIAEELGINIPYVSLIKGKKYDYFLIERFDIKNNRRVHTISVSGLLETDYNVPSLDYLDLIKLTTILTNDMDQIIEMYRRMVFNVLFSNLDDHSKNFAFIYDEESKIYKLSPAYDLTPSSTYYGEHTTSVNGKGKNITDEDMIEVAKKSKINVGIALEIIRKAKQLKEKYNY